MTASVYVSIILNTELYRESYASVGLDDVDLARTTLEGTAMLGGMVPWSNGALLVIATTGAAAWSYFPFCYGCWASMILLVMWGFMGKHLTKRKVIGDEAKPEPIEV
ncbi:Malate-2H(+)/Na(+)-lactate antiporter [bioreactor metagenome]|uniref:Malate-2H(+)/Na(+)-lactate antiporter n=1 Tax=bioreactor metagenome TaxID=1076179 RepID=A0A645J446_9ZZZZ